MIPFLDSAGTYRPFDMRTAATASRIFCVFTSEREEEVA